MECLGSMLWVLCPKCNSKVTVTRDSERCLMLYKRFTNDPIVCPVCGARFTAEVHYVLSTTLVDGEEEDGDNG